MKSILLAFEKDQQLEIRRLIKSTLLRTKSKITSVETIGGAKSQLYREKLRTANYIYCNSESSDEDVDTIDNTIDEYLKCLKLNTIKCPLEFWRTRQFKWPELAQIAKKYLGVPASSAAVERMFSICGFLNSDRRRMTGISLFENQVVLKLNENLLLK